MDKEWTLIKGKVTYEITQEGEEMEERVTNWCRGQLLKQYRQRLRNLHEKEVADDKSGDLLQTFQGRGEKGGRRS